LPDERPGRPGEKVANGARDLCAVRFQREMARVEEMNFGTRDIALERFKAKTHTTCRKTAGT
jgi:hypothetical protein